MFSKMCVIQLQRMPIVTETPNTKSGVTTFGVQQHKIALTVRFVYLQVDG